MTRLAEMFNVNHFIVSQVNPHVVPFLAKDEKLVGQEPPNPSVAVGGYGWLDNLSHLAKSEALHRMRTLAELGVLPNLLTKTVSVLSQKYSGDITIFPDISYADFPRMLSNPTPEYMHLAMLSGQRATWPKLSVIKNHCAIELALDDAVQKLRTRVVFSDEEVDSRAANRISKQPNGAHPGAARHRSGGRRHISREEITLDSLADKSSAQKPTPLSERNRSHRLNLSLRHKKSLSINTFLVQPHVGERPPESRPATADAVARSSTSHHPGDAFSHQSKNLHDLTSSGADETSNLSQSSSSTSLDFSSPTESPSSPAEPTPKWSTSVFGSSSQPASPFPMSDSLSMSKLDIPNSMTRNPSSKSDRGADSGASSPEPRYRRLFQRSGQSNGNRPTSNTQTTNNSPKANMKARATVPASATSAPPTQRKGWGVDINFPATAKDMIAKSKGKKKGSNIANTGGSSHGSEVS